MNKYEVCVDYTNDSWENIQVASFEIDANNCKEARNKTHDVAIKELEVHKNDIYVWEVSEGDKIE
jgi:hypothetical protein